MNINEIASDPSLSESTYLLLKTSEINFPEYLAEVQFILENQLNLHKILPLFTKESFAHFHRFVRFHEWPNRRTSSD